MSCDMRPTPVTRLLLPGATLRPGLPLAWALAAMTAAAFDAAAWMSLRLLLLLYPPLLLPAPDLHAAAMVMSCPGAWPYRVMGHAIC
jgi:hypothetical protein